jgi:AsmA protein
MSKSKIILFAVSGFVAVLTFGAVALLLFVDANAYKPRLESTASEALGMDVRVGGRMSIRFFPDIRVTLEDLHIRNRGADVASVTEATLGIDLLPLLQSKVEVRKIVLNHLRISIERGRDGRFNFETPEAAKRTLSTLALERVFVSDGSLVYVDRQSGEGFEAEDCNLDLPRLRLTNLEGPDFLKNLSFNAELACGEIATTNFAASDLKFSAKGKNGVFDLKPITVRVFGAHGAGSIHADFSDVAPHHLAHFSLSQFRIEEFFKTLVSEKVAEGSMDFSANLSMQGKTVNEMKQTMEGPISLRGKKLIIIGSDLDQAYSQFESSQNFNLVDVGAFFFAGPVGLLVTKGYNFASIFQGTGGSSEIRTLVSDWKVERGVAQAQDVAMATNENRVALKGGLDFVTGQFNDVTVALIDDKGCAKVQQKIYGSFEKPVVEQPNILESLAGPALELLKKGTDIFTGGECEVFYTGSITPPK